MKRVKLVKLISCHSRQKGLCDAEKESPQQIQPEKILYVHYKRDDPAFCVQWSNAHSIIFHEGQYSDHIKKSPNFHPLCSVWGRCAPRRQLFYHARTGYAYRKTCLSGARCHFFGAGSFVLVARGQSGRASPRTGRPLGVSRAGVSILEMQMRRRKVAWPDRRRSAREKGDAWCRCRKICVPSNMNHISMVKILPKYI